MIVRFAVTGRALVSPSLAKNVGLTLAAVRSRYVTFAAASHAYAMLRPVQTVVFRRAFVFMSQSDAQSVVSYLASVKRPKRSSSN
tara:strand:- start:6795 stop:7049 length:255 start_codon:yes stop_codon:yes gene_type:complete